ncbi:MAG: DUF2797 domain-containing protein [Candidatus Thorarchaeota archaeon]|nr:DUF2797 domain-containing protein [Candidatus Thorarchaeota archaeon]
MLVMDVTWIEHDSRTYESGISVWVEGKTEPEFIPLPPGKSISWSFIGPKKCIGVRESFGENAPCPEGAAVRKGMVRCGPCAALDSMDPCIRCTGKECRASEERLAQCQKTEYGVYVVIFNDRTLKVGVSSRSRLRTRWIEQGADYAGVLAKVTGGMSARRFEDTLGRVPGATKQVRAERKAKQLLDTLAIDEAQSILEDYLNSLQTIDINRPVELVDLSTYYSLGALAAKPTPWRKRSMPVDTLKLVGAVVGMKGSLLVTRLGNAYTVTNLRNLIGYTIDDSQELTIAAQSGLMDFL